jgi:predicted molibdopterin-dependent oxidoreductase YjgC
VWVEVSAGDASRLGVAEGDVVEVSTPRGTITCAARICGIRDGVLFVPFHYGYWDTDRREFPAGHHRAGNELTPTDWDPVSKQPIYKTGAARLEKSRNARAGRASANGFAAAPTTAASAPVNGAVRPTTGGDGAGVAEMLPTGGQQ